MVLEYNFYIEDMFKTWTLIDILERYDATKTDRYFIFKNSKCYIWKTNFKNTDNLKPIIAELNTHLTSSIEVFFYCFYITF